MADQIDQVWECPKCGAQIAAGKPGELSPPSCHWGHSRTEMEQKTVEAFHSPDSEGD